jgi:carotenoid 1,2-hydratase
VTFYDAVRRRGGDRGVALRFGADGTVAAIEPPPPARLKPSFWRLERATRADPGYAPAQVKSMLDVPFYTRSMVRTQIGGAESVGVHETLDLDRFVNPINQMLLPLRMPRRAVWNGARG